MRELLSDVEPFTIELGNTKIFDPSDNSEGTAVIVVQVIGRKLKLLRAAVADAVGSRSDDFEYEPHVTIAYVKPSAADKYDDLDDLDGEAFTVDEIAFISSGGKKTVLPFGKSTTKTIRRFKASGSQEDDIDSIISDLLDGFDELPGPIGHEMAAMFLDRAKQMREEVGAADSISLSELNSMALDFSKERGAELVGKKWVAGELEDNPDARWAITDTTRDWLKELITRAFDEGLTPSQLKTEIDAAGVFGAARADMIASTEMARSQIQGSLRTALATGVVGKSSETSGDHDLDDECDGAEDEGVIAIDEDFEAGDGPPYHPGCLVAGTIVASCDRVTKQFRRPFHGETITIELLNGEKITITPNHPMLSREGWIPAGSVDEHSYLAYCDDPRGCLETRSPYDKLMPVMIEQVASSLLKSGGVRAGFMPLSSEDFHGDAIPDSEVEIVLADRFVKHERDAVLDEDVRERSLIAGHRRGSDFESSRPSYEFRQGDDATASRAIRSSASSLALCERETDSIVERSLGESSQREIVSLERTANASAAESDAPADVDARFAGEIAYVKVVDVKRQSFSGQVYNLETESGYYFANGLIVHNCNCALVFYTADDPEASDLISEEQDDQDEE